MSAATESAKVMNRLASALKLPERTRRVEIILDVKAAPLLRIEAYAPDGSLAKLERVLRLADD